MVTTTQTISQSARLKVTSSSTIQQSAFLDSIQTLSQNAKLKTSTEQQVVEGVWIKISGQTQTLSENTTLKETSTQNINENTTLKDTFSKTLSQNAGMKAISSQVLSENATLKEISIRALSENARLKDTFSKTLNQNATLKEIFERLVSQNATLKASGTVRLLTQNVTISTAGQIQTLSENATLKVVQTQALSQNATIKDNPSAGPVNVYIDIDSVASPKINSEFQVVLRVTANNGVPVAGKAVFLQRSTDGAATFKFVKKAITGNDGIVVIKWKEPLMKPHYEPAKIHYRGFFQTQGVFTENYSTAVEISIISGNLRSPTPIPFVTPHQAVTMMKGDDFYVLLPSGVWMRLPKIMAESVGKITINPNT